MATALIVDDSEFMRLRLRNIIEELGHVVVGEASNGMEAYTVYRDLKPDFITMDITMPVMNGIDAVQRIKYYDQNAQILMVSALNQKDLVIKALQSGAKDFIVKPFQKDRVKKSIDNIVSVNAMDILAKLISSNYIFK